MEVNEKIFYAMQDLKGLDHLIHFSLKYTRTTNVLRNVLEKIKNVEESLIDAMFYYIQTKDASIQKQTVSVLKSKVSCDFFDDQVLNENHAFYLKVKKLLRIDSSRRGDFRKHVALIYDFDGEEYIFDLKEATDYYNKLREYFAYILGILEIKPFQVDFDDFLVQ